MNLLKRITALICVAALLFTSTGAGTFAYAYENQESGKLKIAPVAESEVFNPKDIEIYEEGISTFAFKNVYNGSYRSQLSENEQNYYDQLKAAFLTGNDSDPSTIRPREDVPDTLTLSEAMDYKLPASVEYDEIGNGTISLTEEGNAMCQDIYNELFYAYFALTRDYPILFWYAGGSAGLKLEYKGDPTILEIAKITFATKESYPNAKSQISAFNTGLENVYNRLNTKENTKDEYTTIKAIHDYLCQHITYNYDAVDNAGSADYKYAHSPGVVFIQENSSVVCEGYGEAFKILCDMFDIPCALVMGTGNGGAHLWNYVQVDGNWYAVDVTWDDQSTIIYNYFMKGSNNFDDHIAENNAFSADRSYTFAYPLLSVDDYVYVEKTEHKHTPAASVVENNIAPTCTTDGSYDTVVYCSEAKCRAELERNITTVPMLGHNEIGGEVEKATYTENGHIGAVYCDRCDNLLENEKIIYAVTSLKLSAVKYTYNNTVKKPAVTVKDSNGTTLVQDTDYEVVYGSGRKAVGRYSVTVNLKGNYSGSKTLYFTIVPKASTSASATLYGYNDVKFTWAKSTGASGYNVYYKKASASSYTLLKATTANYVKEANLSDGVKYNFKVIPYFKDASGNKYFDSSQYKVASIYTLKKLNIPAVTKSGTKVKVKWNNINGESGYQISKSTSKTGTNIVSTYATTSGTYKTVTATKSKTYYYKVRAYKVVGKTKIFGPWSNVKSFKR